jgi:hypothetical protein
MPNKRGGPATAAGKAKVGQNSRRHGLRSRDGEAFEGYVAELNRLLRKVRLNDHPTLGLQCNQPQFHQWSLTELLQVQVDA